ncbi:MAG: RDD family protein [SAR202 cluster bacterium]|nr:RDD family protein [SAR202 cluster bacterium]MDP6514538.1 RDD family protein [SAR202 cluster bacterium]MDP6715221.1 RDD family protein [SAR202 cluster bacterium]
MPVECPNCGTANPDNALYCRNCGQLMEPLEVPEQPRPAPEVEELGILADRLSRLIASIVDRATLVVPMFFILFILDSVSLLVVYLAAWFLVQATLLTTTGQTVGKKAFNVRIVMVETGRNGGFVPNVLVRMVLNGALGLIPFYSLVDVLFIFRSDRRCIHDLIAGTVVVKA